ncbi:MAG: alpha/beta hydrolase [Erysipelotrichaceae bacterium]|nr:alpha/beta hydrolase [Erysipelotrichaceae bacterium]
MILLYIFLALLFVFIFLLYIIYCLVFYHSSKNKNDDYNIPNTPQYLLYNDKMVSLIDDLKAKPYEEVSITSYDGLTLYGKYYHVQDNAPLDIAIHGYKGSDIRDMCKGVQISFALNHNVLLIDQRAHGKSKGHSITFGIKERKDCLSWINYAKKRFGKDVKIFLYGVSMGASSILMACKDINDDDVSAIIADSPYYSAHEIIKKVCKDLKLSFIMPLISLSAMIFAHINLKKISAIDAVKNCKVPILIMHGEDDYFVPCKASEEIAKANKNIKRYTFSLSGHGLSGIVHEKEYEEIVMDFISKIVKDKQLMK